MCEMFAFSAPRKIDYKKELATLISHSDKNPDGWGLIRFEDELNSSQAQVDHEACRADQSSYLAEICENLQPAQLALAHVREATSKVKLENCHPFEADDASGRHWFFMHNGYLRREDKTAAYHEIQVGDTDSERLFLYLLDCIKQQFETDPESLNTLDGRLALLDHFVAEVAGPGNKLNLVIFDGDYLYVHTNTEQCTLHYLQLADCTMFATQPLNDLSWAALPTNQVIAYKLGRKVAAGKRHNQLFLGGEPISFEEASA